MEKVIDWLSPSKSFYSRVIFVLVPFTVFVCILYSAFIRASIQFVEDQIITDYLQREWQAIESQNYKDPNGIVFPNTSYITSFTESDPNLPASFKNLSLGIHEFVHADAEIGEFPKVTVNGYNYNLEDEDYHLLIETIPHSSRKAYLLLNENKLSSINQYEDLFLSIIYAIAGIVIIMGSLIAITLARYISNPIQTLNKELSESKPPNAKFKSQFRQDEIGQLANGFSELLNKLKDAIEREKAFTRHASHELRTPLTVANNAISVLGLPNISVEKRDKNISRLKESMSEMETLIEVFLLLGRNETSKDVMNVSIQHILDECIAKYSHQMQTNQIVKLDIVEQSVSSNEPLLKVTIDNLIRNSIFHGTGEIKIHFDGKQLTISNLTNDSESGYGYGLEIIERISKSMGWTLTYQQSETVFQVQLQLLEA